MNKEVYLHIGFPRTGTTFLQQEVFPKIEGLHFQHTMEKPFVPVPGKNLWSNEDFCGKPYIRSDFDRKCYLYGLSRLYPKAKVIIGIRDKESLFKSMYTIFVKAGWAASYEKAREIMEVKYGDFDAIFQLVYDLFGKNNTYIYRFEDFVENKRDCIDGICKFMGVKTPQYRDIRINVSWNERQLKLCRFLNIINAKPGMKQGFYSNKFFVNLLADDVMMKRNISIRKVMNMLK